MDAQRWGKRPIYHEIRAKSALNRVQGMPFGWSLNPYRGCRHACHYCYARPTHAYFDLHPGEDFSRHIFVKMNLPEVLSAEVARRSWRRECVAIGTVTDPYQPAEGEYRLTRRCLEVLAAFRTPAGITTKGTLIVRDVDMLQAVRDQAGSCTVNVSLITLDARVSRVLEPGVPPPQQRLAAMRRLADAGIRVGLALAPVLPGITDAPSALEEVIHAAADHGASFAWAGTVHLEPTVRDWLLAQLSASFPRAAIAYRRWFGAPGTLAGARYTPRTIERRTSRLVREIAACYGLPQPEQRRPGTAPTQITQQLGLGM